MVDVDREIRKVAGRFETNNPNRVILDSLISLRKFIESDEMKVENLELSGVKIDNLVKMAKEDHTEDSPIYIATMELKEAHTKKVAEGNK